jgi:excisionase family DNA binding protein
MNSPDKLNGQDQAAARGRVSAGKAAPGTLKFFTVNQVAEVLSLSTRQVRRLIAGRQLPVHRFGGVVRIGEADLRSFIAVHRD